MRPELPNGTVTFLFTDVEGSTKLLHELGAEAYAEALAEHRRVIREACAAEGGVEVDTQGDAFFFAFPTAPGALDAASAFTEMLVAGPISVRVGLHTGTPLLADEGYVGDDVHFAARVASSGHGGQVVLSGATAAVVDVELVDLGEHRLKDIPNAVPIFQLGSGSFPPLKTISNTNLPRPASSFVGRDARARGGRVAARSGSPPRHAHRSRRHREDPARPGSGARRSSPSTRQASSGSGLPRCATPHSSRRQSRRASAQRMVSLTTSASASFSCSSTTWSR